MPFSCHILKAQTGFISGCCARLVTLIEQHYPTVTCMAVLDGQGLHIDQPPLFKPNLILFLNTDLRPVLRDLHWP